MRYDSIESNRELLLRYAEAVSIPLSLSDTTKWPVRSGRILRPVRARFASEFFAHVEACGLDQHPELWAKYFCGPSQLWRMSHHLISGLREADVTDETTSGLLLVLLRGIDALSGGQGFVPMGIHAIGDSGQMPEIGPEPEMIRVSSDVHQLLRLSALLWSYSESVYFVARELGCEYHGPYTLPDGKRAIIRDFRCLEPRDLWHELSLPVLPRRVRIISLHDASLDLRFDVYNNVFVERGNVAESAVSAHAFVHGRELSGVDLCGIERTLVDAISMVVEFVEKLDRGDLAERYVEVFWYRKAALAKACVGDWRPQADVLARARESFEAKRTKKVRSRPAREEIAQVFDLSGALHD